MKGVNTLECLNCPIIDRFQRHRQGVTVKNYSVDENIWVSHVFDLQWNRNLLIGDQTNMKYLIKFVILGLILITGACSHGRGHKGHMKALDTDKDGSISKVEWSQHFKKVDANSDGQLTKDELHGFHKNQKAHCGKDSKNECSKGACEKCEKGDCEDCAKGECKKCGDSDCKTQKCSHEHGKTT
jgi:hypothetical protein